jgi:multidrug efflux pump subunit AcrA (membrane-fusion protein)
MSRNFTSSSFLLVLCLSCPVRGEKAPTACRGAGPGRGRRGAAGAGGGAGGGGPVPVVTAKVQSKSVPVTIPAVGTAEPLPTVQIRARSPAS